MTMKGHIRVIQRQLHEQNNHTNYNSTSAPQNKAGFNDRLSFIIPTLSLTRTHMNKFTTFPTLIVLLGSILWMKDDTSLSTYPPIFILFPLKLLGWIRIKKYKKEKERKNQILATGVK